MDFRCIECGFHIRSKKSLYVQYSPGNIRLMKCESCRAVADEYIECEIMILLIDLILHKPKAYRHLLYNKLDQQALFWKAGISFLVLDAYRLLILSGREEGVSDMWISFPSLTYPKMLMNLIFGNIAFLVTVLLWTRSLLKDLNTFLRCEHILLAIFLSSYFKIFLIAMMVWEFPLSVLLIIDLFVLSSNTVAFKVMTELPLDKCIMVCFSAHAIKFFVGWLI
ncbi:protein ARV 1 [Impatiens glandulifera]|uniref:protein ARV 1 n=1 Tax=Impatiens glandulifera TaxID=253017 RepID=UPI001FB159E1|nr:protein ARV 1 [Impatiens glandulifera]